jgi:peptide-methionine (S)-S-oxide reductase
MKHSFYILLLALPIFANCQPKKNSNATNTTATKKINKKNMETNPKNIDTVTLGAGCFWCTEAIYQQVQGVLTVRSGYSGGHIENPTYEQVCDKTTGHAEVIQITYDSSIVPFTKILEVFFKTHDPTTLNQQGADKGPQYRSAIFYHNNNQLEIATQVKNALDASGAFANPIVTEITAFTNYYDAELYHQNYYNQNKNSNGYCSFVIQPKIEKFKKAFADLLK